MNDIPRWARVWLVLDSVVVPAVFVVVWVAQWTIVTLPVAGQLGWLVPLTVVLVAAPAVGSALWLWWAGLGLPRRWPVLVALSGVAQFALAFVVRAVADFPDAIEPWFPAVPMGSALWLLGVVLAVAARRATAAR